MPRTPTVVLTTLGSLGDLFPYLAIARELRRRGHRAIVATSASYREIIEAEGVEFRKVRPDFPHFVEHPDWVRMATDARRGAEYIIRRMILPFLEESYADAVDALRDADLVVTHSMGYAAKLAAEKLCVPWAVAGLQPSIFFSSYDPPLVLPKPFADRHALLGRPYYSAMFTVVKAVTRRWAKPIRNLRRKLDLPARRIDPLIEGQFSATLNLALFSPLLAHQDPDWPVNTVQTGFVFFGEQGSIGEGGSVGVPAQASLPQELAEFLECGEPPIVFTLGSLAVLDPGPFFAESVSAARSLGRRIVLLTGTNPPDSGSVPPGDDLFITGFVPHAAIFPRASVIVHQGGIGTTAEALRAGRPMLIVPFSNDQPDNGRRAARLGVARVVSRSAYRSRRVASEIRELLGTPGYASAAARVSAQIAREQGVKLACDAIEGRLGFGDSRPVFEPGSHHGRSLGTM